MRVKTYSYITGNNDEDKNAKGTEKFVIKRKIKFEDYKRCLEATQLQNKTNQLDKTKVNVDSCREKQRIYKKQ